MIRSGKSPMHEASGDKKYYVSATDAGGMLPTNDPAKAIEQWFSLAQKYPMDSAIQCNKQSDAIALLKWAESNQNTITEWHKQYHCKMKLEYMLSTISKYAKSRIPGWVDNAMEQISPFAIQ